MKSHRLIKSIIHTAVLNSFLVCSTFSVNLQFSNSFTALHSPIPNPIDCAKTLASLYSVEALKSTAVVKASEKLLKQVPFDKYIEDLADLQARVILKNHMAILKKTKMINFAFENALSKKIIAPFEALQCQSIIKRANEELAKLLHISKLKIAQTTSLNFLKTISNRFGILLATNIVTQWYNNDHETSFSSQLKITALDVVLTEIMYNLLSLVTKKFKAVNPWDSSLSYQRVASMLTTMEPYLEDIISTFNQPDALSKEKAYSSLKYLLIAFYKNDPWYYNTSLFVANHYPQVAGFIVPNKYTVIETINCGPIAYSKAKEPQDAVIPTEVIPSTPAEETFAPLTPIENATPAILEPALTPSVLPAAELQVTITATPSSSIDEVPAISSLSSSDASPFSFVSNTRTTHDEMIEEDEEIEE